MGDPPVGARHPPVPQPGAPSGRLSELRWPDLDGGGRRPVLAVPVGSLEQHGPHLPLDTDTRIAVALAERLATARPAVLVAPPLAYGASDEHAGFPGTLSIGHGALADAIVSLVRSARATFAGVVVVNAHGGNAEATAAAARRCRADGDDLLVWEPVVPAGDAHAGRTETSILLAVAPSAVRAGAAAPGRTEPLAALIGDLRSVGVRAVSPTGVLGDPTGATAEEGRRLLDALVDRLVTAVDAWAPGPGGGAGHPQIPGDGSGCGDGVPGAPAGPPRRWR